jgi:hypothetical protein
MLLDDATEAEAARYRWLRNVAWDEPTKLAAFGDWCFSAKELDDAIDAAMQGRPWGTTEREP